MMAEVTENEPRTEGEETEEDYVIYVPSNFRPNERGLGYQFFSSMKKYKNLVAQYNSETGEEQTYEELLKRCIRTALHLRERNLSKEDDIVMLCTNNHQDSCVPFIASLFLGVPVASLDPGLSVMDTSHLLKQVTPKVLFIVPDALDLIEISLKEAGVEMEIVIFGESERYTDFSEFLQYHEDEESFFPEPVSSLQETVVIFFSSGTTGLPKGIMINHYALMGQAENLINSGNVGSVTLSYASLYWISSVLLLSAIVSTGGARVLCSHFDPVELWLLIERYKVVNTDTDKLCGPNEPGELRVKGKYIMNGYFKRDSSESFDSHGWLRTGDIVYYDEHGCFYVVDRIKEMLKYKSWHVAPAMLEQVLVNHPAVKEALVIGVPHDEDGDLPMALITLNKESKETTTENDIESYVAERVPDRMKLRGGVKFLENFLVTPSGKVKRGEMKNMVLNGEL